MTYGKARLVKVRRCDRARFDQLLIDDFLGEAPPQPERHRAVRVVYGASRLTEGLSGEPVRLVDPQPAAAVIGHAHAAMERPRQQTFLFLTDKGEARLTPSCTRVGGSRRPGSEEGDAGMPPMRLAGEAKKPREPREPFTWRGFMLGAALGTAAGLAIVAILRALGGSA